MSPLTASNGADPHMPHANARLEAFCDGVFAIAITLLVIELRVTSPAAIGDTADGLLSVGALWFPLPVAIITTATWAFWLVLSIRTRLA